MRSASLAGSGRDDARILLRGRERAPNSITPNYGNWFLTGTLNLCQNGVTSVIPRAPSSAQPPGGPAAFVIFIVDEGGERKQHVQARMTSRDRKVILGCCFMVSRAEELAAPIFYVLRSATLL